MPLVGVELFDVPGFLAGGGERRILDSRPRGGAPLTYPDIPCPGISTFGPWLAVPFRPRYGLTNGNMYDTPISTDDPTTAPDRDRDALAPSPSTGWRGVYRIMEVAL